MLAGMAHRICPWWLGYLLASPVRRLLHNPRAIVAPFVAGGMTVLEPGPGMGFFTLELARLVGPTGRIVAIDVQPLMLEALRRRARKAGLAGRIETRQPKGEHLGIEDLKESVGFALVFAVAHEVPRQDLFLADIHSALKGGARFLLAEPAGHVSEEDFGATLREAERAGFKMDTRPVIRRCRTALLVKS